MKSRILLVILSYFFSLGVQAVELLINPRFLNNAEGWSNWGSKKGMTAISTLEGLLLKCDSPGLNQGIAQSLSLKPGYKYEYSCRLRGTLEASPASSVTLLSWYSPVTKTGSSFRTLIGDFEWDVHTTTFTIPANASGELLFRPIILTGPGAITLEWASLKEIGPGELPKQQSKTKLPEIKPVIHPKIKIDLSAEIPANIRAHVKEKLSPLPQGSSITNINDEFVIHYAFSTPGHDAVMFDIVKEIPSCAKISLEITADGAGHRMFFVLTDSSGESHYVTKPLILDFTQKSLTFTLTLPPEKPYDILDSIWGGDRNQHLDLPLRSLTIGIDDSPDATIGQGTITLKKLQIGNW
ncbi:MAG: hypothetical protein WCT05_03570 [Lentisphaeria bacterium]